jgi:inner membrane protein
MASLISHPASVIALWLGGPQVSRRLLVLSVCLTLLPDADVIAFRFGVPYESQWGHRGFTHSISFALFLGVLCQCFHRQLAASRMRVFVWTFLATLSHALLDALTNGGLGVALLWPLSSERFFAPFRPIEVSPIGVRGFLSLRGVVVVLSEILWVWLPLLILSFSVKRLRR